MASAHEAGRVDFGNSDKKSPSRSSAQSLLIPQLHQEILQRFGRIITLGLGWMLYPILWPAVALVYSAFSLGGPHSATIGMRSQGIEGRFMDGSRLNPGIAAIHAVLFYFSVSVLTPLVLLVSLFTKDKRLLHDIVLGIVFVNRY